MDWDHEETTEGGIPFVPLRSTGTGFYYVTKLTETAGTITTAVEQVAAT